MSLPPPPRGDCCSHGPSLPCAPPNSGPLRRDGRVSPMAPRLKCSLSTRRPRGPMAGAGRTGEIREVSLEEVRGPADLKGRGSGKRWSGKKTPEKSGTPPHPGKEPNSNSSDTICLMGTEKPGARCLHQEATCALARSPSTMQQLNRASACQVLKLHVTWSEGFRQGGWGATHCPVPTGGQDGGPHEARDSHSHTVAHLTDKPSETCPGHGPRQDG